MQLAPQRRTEVGRLQHWELVHPQGRGTRGRGDSMEQKHRRHPMDAFWWHYRSTLGSGEIGHVTDTLGPTTLSPSVISRGNQFTPQENSPARMVQSQSEEIAKDLHVLGRLPREGGVCSDGRHN